LTNQRRVFKFYRSLRWSRDTFFIKLQLYSKASSQMALSYTGLADAGPKKSALMS
jgi:hypothetical protein